MLTVFGDKRSINIIMEYIFKTEVEAKEFAAKLLVEGGNRIERIGQCWGGWLVNWVEVTSQTAQEIANECGYASFAEMIAKNIVTNAEGDIDNDAEGYGSIISELNELCDNITENTLFVKVWDNSSHVYELAQV